MTAAKIGVTAIAPKSGDDLLKGVPSDGMGLSDGVSFGSLKLSLH